MPARVLVVNAGSSSLKLRLLDGEQVAASADLPAGDDGFDVSAVRDAVAAWPVPDVAGHRIVHGGTQFGAATRFDAGVRENLGALIDLAPLHQPKSLAGLDAVSAVLPDVPAYACFDTAFHATIGPAAATYAVPAAWRERYGVRRYGFHGLSHAYLAARTAELTDARRIVSCHLGAGASLCAVLDGRSVDTTMGFTPLEGLVMATRSGSVDPGLVLWLEEHERLAPREVAAALEQRSGLLALAGTPDMREVQRRADGGDGAARLALDVYGHRLAAGIAAMTGTLGGVEAIAFTGGVGEHAAAVRADAARRLGWLGVAVDAGANAAAVPDCEVTADGADVRVLVIAAREDLQIAREVRAAAGDRAAG